jgi:hypothetical protein
VRGETVWKIEKAPRLGSHEWAKGLEKTNFAVLCHRTYTIETPSAIFQTVSEGTFSEVRQQGSEMVRLGCTPTYPAV